MSETKTFRSTKGETDWLVIEVSNTDLSVWATATLKIGLQAADGTETYSTPDSVTVENNTVTRIASLLGPAGSLKPAAGQYLPRAQVSSGSALFSIECPGDVVVVV